MSWNKQKAMDPPEKFEIGDVIYAYQDGVWMVTKVTERHGHSRKQLLTGNWTTPKKPCVKECDAAWCRKASVEQIRQDAEEKCRALTEALNGVS